jgi:hypothetical protein
MTRLPLRRGVAPDRPCGALGSAPARNGRVPAGIAPAESRRRWHGLVVRTRRHRDIMWGLGAFIVSIDRTKRRKTTEIQSVLAQRPGHLVASDLDI